MDQKELSVFEAVAGENAFGILGQALRAQKKRIGRSFVSSDIALRREETLRQRGLSTEPSNLKLAKGCSMNELKKLPKSSMDIVFDSFFLFDYSRERRNFIRKKMEKDYFREAMRVLKPNGRIITIQARFNEQFIREHAKKLGLRMHTIRLTQKQLDESSATWVKKRATKKGRMEVLEGNFSPDDEYSMRMFKESLRQVGIKQLEEAHYPVAIILRK